MKKHSNQFLVGLHGDKQEEEEEMEGGRTRVSIGEGGEGGQQDGEQRYMKAKLALHRLNSPETPRGVSWK